ncbi:MAG: DUF1552 domain-containing protein [Planctomycetota bacterium]
MNALSNSHRLLSRRHLLRGCGAAAIALPAFEVMGPSRGSSAYAAAAFHAPKRTVLINAGLGFHAPHLFPDSPGKLKPSTPYLQQLNKHLEQMTLFSGLSHPEQQGNNGHASSLTILTSAPRPGLAGFRNTISIDQLIAQQVGLQTRYPFLALSSGGGNSLSWTASGVGIPAESSPAKLFQALFIEGSASDVDKELARLRRGRSILDTVAERAQELERQISAHDRQKLDQYMTSIRDLEMRMVQSEGWVKRPKPQVDADPPTDINDKLEAIKRQELLYDIIVLALQTDSTRTVTLALSGLNAAPNVPGVSSDWHGLSHHGKDPNKINELKLIEEAEFAAFGEFLGKLKAVESEGGSLLDGTAVLFGSNLGNASAHDWHNLPILLAGGGYRHGNYVAHDRDNNTPLANLFVALARRAGLEIDAFGSSTSAHIDGLELAPS